MNIEGLDTWNEKHCRTRRVVVSLFGFWWVGLSLLSKMKCMAHSKLTTVWAYIGLYQPSFSCISFLSSMIFQPIVQLSNGSVHGEILNDVSYTHRGTWAELRQSIDRLHKCITCRRTSTCSRAVRPNTIVYRRSNVNLLRTIASTSSSLCCTIWAEFCTLECYKPSTWLHLVSRMYPGVKVEIFQHKVENSISESNRRF